MSERPLHVLFAVHGYKPAYRVGGPILSVAAAADGLVKKGHRVTVFTSNSNLDEDLDVPVNTPTNVNGVEVWYFKRLTLKSPLIPAYFAKSMGFLYAPAMAGELDRLVPRVDVVHTHLPFVYPSMAAGRAAIRWHKPLFYHQRGVFDPQRLRFRSLKKKLYIRGVEVPIMRGATTLIALTAAEEKSYRALGVDTPVAVIPNGIAVDEYRTQSRQSDNELGIPQDALVVLFMGRLHPIKGADALVSAFIKVAQANPAAVLVMAGPDEWGVEAKLTDAANAAGVRGRVIFTGMVTGERKKDLLARADLFCLPSDGEGFSMAVLEAMASGTAVMLSPGCHFPDSERYGAGTIVGTTVAALEAGLRTLLADRARLTEMGGKGRALVSDQYRWEAIVDRLIAVYRAGIERRARD